MAEDAAYSKAEVDILVGIAKVETKQDVLNDSFVKHQKEDDEHFSKLYTTNEKILEALARMPQKINQSGESFKTSILQISRKEFVSKTTFSVFKTWIVAGVSIGVAVGSAVASIIMYFITLPHGG